ncbi:MAG: hypothetical protein ACFN4S_03965 [Prevotella conceptionensis]|uniref:hypothetical protein n=1 Tax=Prevotella conceptionensis TaxID=340486 RepID=UPI0005CA37BE|nr:hypothetical protein [Prevotella conceptionensis]
MQNISIYNEELLSRVFSRKRRKGIVAISYDLDWLPLNRKIDFTVNKLCSYRFHKARLTLHFWEPNEVLERMLKECAVDDYEMTRAYKPMRMRPGVVHINFVNEFNTRFLKVLITKHYGFENARPDTLNVTPSVAMDTDKELIAIKLYDDRGFYEYVIEKR